MESILGKQFVDDGITEEQMLYFFRCCSVVDVSQIENDMLSIGSAMTDEKGQKTIKKILNDKRSSLIKYFLKD